MTKTKYARRKSLTEEELLAKKKTLDKT